MKVWNPIQNLVNPNPQEISNHQESLKQKQKRTSAIICPKCKGNHDERDCTKFLFKEEKQRSVSPQPIKPNPQVDKSETKVKEKWNPLERKNNVDKDTEKWVEEQNAFFEKKREKQKDEVPVRFDSKGPVNNPTEEALCLHLNVRPSALKIKR